ncbi:tyrosine-protein phosphatase [Gordonia sp. CPCC 206044]|uniref:tyrosine-protein phosphatase n=1 Tax=Gordonia sp. CPCC 206044 TaxID=3140793 RepID=UPI003AF3A3A7
MTPTRSLPARRLAATLAALAVVGMPALAPTMVGSAGAAPSQQSAVAATPAAVELAGTENTRTFANYRTTAGRKLNDRVIRSDDLSSLTAADMKKLASLHVTSIIDFRTQIERTIQPEPQVPGATLHNFDVLGAAPVTTLVDLSSAYRTFVTDAHARSAFRNTLLDIKSTAGKGDAVLYHCSAGKDRTGWASAVLLTIVGVDRATVERDFLASNTFRHASANDPLNGVNISWLRSAFAAADQTFGSFDNYVHKGLGLTNADIAGLKKAVLA